VLFLGCAAEDGEIAIEVAEWLSGHMQDEVHRRLPGHPDPTIDTTDERIRQAHAYIVLLSPDFLTDPLCRRERELAMCREQGLRLKYPTGTFVHVLLVRDAGELTDNLPPRDLWLDVTDRRDLPSALVELAARLESAEAAAAAAAASPGRGAILFRNRADELEVAVRGLTNSGGPHFWLVIAPPQLGKTWFLDRLSAALLLGQRGPWEVKLVDIRDQKTEVRTDVGSLLRCLFGPDSPTALEPDTYLRIAQKIIASRRQHLYMIDSAELIPEATARDLRACLSKIHNNVSEAGLSQVRFAVAVASRRENEWRGITPDPRLSILPLTGFSVDVVREAMTALADEMDRHFYTARLMLDVDRVYRLSEGLPALLTRCIAWIRHEGWLGMERLESEQLFRELAQPYIKDSLLAPDSLFPLNHGQADTHAGAITPSLALEHALRILAPYRLFTRSHLSYYLTRDVGLSTSLAELSWTIEDLWRAISSSALLKRPLNEPWQEIPGAIRRLLFRHYYLSKSECIAAHQEAREFMALWADQQIGKEQIVGLVECLWHEAAALRLDPSLILEADLIDSASRLSRGLRRSVAYTEEELREFAAERIIGDEEFENTIGDQRIFDAIIESVQSPQSE
jgi:hypothetical protein